MFSTAKVLAAPTAKAKASTKAEVQLNGLEQLAMVDALIKSLEGIKASLDADVKSEALDLFIQSAVDNNGKRPDSFRGLDGAASASIELRKRSTNSVLTEDQILLLGTKGVVGEVVVITTEMFGINPAYNADSGLLGKVEKALKGIVPEDFIVKQEGKSKTVVSEDTITAAFKALPSMKTPMARAFVEAVGTLAIKPKLETTDIGTLFNKVRDFMVEEV